jgi:hypothetical protein
MALGFCHGWECIPCVIGWHIVSGQSMQQVCSYMPPVLPSKLPAAAAVAVCNRAMWDAIAWLVNIVLCRVSLRLAWWFASCGSSITRSEF